MKTIDIARRILSVPPLLWWTGCILIGVLIGMLSGCGPNNPPSDPDACLPEEQGIGICRPPQVFRCDGLRWVLVPERGCSQQR